MQLSVLSVGGSIIAPDNVDSSFLSDFLAGIRKYLADNPDAKLVFVCGGGAPARKYQTAFREVVVNADKSTDNAQDWIGIRATHLNAELVRACLGDLCKDPLVIDPTAKDIAFAGRVLVAGGWKPGFSTDTDAVYLARRFGGKLVINLSNIKKVYTDDPRKNPDAVPLDTISWEDFRKMVGTEWVPGKNVPFDPIASGLAQEAGIKVVCADGRNIENTLAVLNGKPFEGTTIG
jgi:uridylate kinase